MSFQSNEEIVNRINAITQEIIGTPPPVLPIAGNFDIFQRTLKAFNDNVARLQDEKSELEFRLTQEPDLFVFPELELPELPIITIPENGQDSNLLRNLLIGGGILLLI